MSAGAGHSKRAFDVGGALAGILLAAPIMVIIATVVTLESGWPFVFAQPRLGRSGRQFRVYKFRKFRRDVGDEGPGVTVADDPRMTWVGKALERSKLDELPQLWNVLCGDMSLVGPRPESLRFADLFVGPHRALLDFAPGLFGPSQHYAIDESANYPRSVDPEQHYRDVLFATKAKIDLDYYPTATAASDLRWSLRCIIAAIRRSLSALRDPRQ